MHLSVFFDLDGCLADFVGGALKHHGVHLPAMDVKWDFLVDIGFKGRENEFWEPLGREFWSGLPLLEDGVKFLSKVETLIPSKRIAFLSSPCATDGCCDGKRDWVRKHFPEYSRRLLLGSAKEVCANRHSILIDDHDNNCDQFEMFGGRAFLLPRPWNRGRHFVTEDGRFCSEWLFQQFKAFLEEVLRERS
jgi:hypothetical protein